MEGPEKSRTVSDVPGRLRLGLYGGSFDPIHHGHLILAREAREQLGLDRVIFIPAAVSPHKLVQPPAPAEFRLEMVRASIDGEPGFEVDDLEIRRPPPSYSIHTVRQYRETYPEADLFYLIGGDNLTDLESWVSIDELRALCQFVLLGRGSSEPVGLPVIDRPVDISSTDIRNRVASGRSIRYLLPEPACEVILRQNLYRSP